MSIETSYNLQQLQDKYGISVRTWREYIKRKDLRAFKIGRTYRVFEQDLINFIKDREAYTWRKKGAYPFDD
jgi:excisionase family DNA binding protein